MVIYRSWAGIHIILQTVSLHFRRALTMTVWNSETAESGVWLYCVLSIADITTYTSPCNAQEERTTPRTTSHGYSPSKQPRQNYFIKTQLARKKHQTKNPTQKHTTIWPAQTKTKKTKQKHQNNYCLTKYTISKKYWLHFLYDYSSQLSKFLIRITTL